MNIVGWGTMIDNEICDICHSKIACAYCEDLNDELTPICNECIDLITEVFNKILKNKEIES